MNQTERIIAVVADAPATSYDVHAETGIALNVCCAMLRSLVRSKRLVRSVEKVKMRRKSPGAYLYSIPPKEIP